VYVIVLNIELDNFPMFPLTDGFENSSQLIFNLFRREYFTPIFRSPHQVVLQVVKTM
jgi:hypothetical protein